MPSCVIFETNICPCAAQLRYFVSPIQPRPLLLNVNGLWSLKQITTLSNDGGQACTPAGAGCSCCCSSGGALESPSKSSRLSDGFAATRAGSPAVGGGELTEGGSCGIAASGGALPCNQTDAHSAQA